MRQARIHIMEAKGTTSRPVLRALVAAAVGLVACVAIWIVTPYNNFVMHNGYIADSYLPIAALAILVLLVLGVNPLLRRLRPALAFTRGQMALMLGMMLVASTLPGQGLLRTLPWSLAQVVKEANHSKEESDVYKQMDLPKSLFPDELGLNLEAPAADRLLNRLLPGETIPWQAWIGPLTSWGILLLFAWAMMIGVGLIVYPQWRDSERLPFPLLNVYDSLIDDADGKMSLAPVFREKLFWLAVGVVFVLHLTSSGNTYLPGRMPVFPLNWNLGSYFTEGIWRHLPGSLTNGKIYFIFFGMAFFMPNRISFSIWVIALLYGLYWMLDAAYMPPAPRFEIADQRTGAMLAMTVGIIWLGRRHWAHVLRCAFRRCTSEIDRRDAFAGRFFLIGCLGMLGWLLWVGVQPLWAVLLVAIGFMVSLLITRLISETGVPLARIYDGMPIDFMKFLPPSMLSAATIYIGGFFAIIFHYGSRVSVAAMATHAIGLNKDAKAGSRNRLAVLMLVLLVVGLVVCGGAHLFFGYHHSVSLDGSQHPISSLGARQMENLVWELRTWNTRGHWRQPSHNRAVHIGFGVGVAGALQWACMAIPKWPLHPIGLLVVTTYFGNEILWSVFFGWLLKVVIVHYGGARAYRSAKPLFLGLIVGEVFASIFWIAIGFVMVALDRPYFRWNLS
jgi:hypothetical protein